MSVSTTPDTPYTPTTPTLYCHNCAAAMTLVQGVDVGQGPLRSFTGTALHQCVWYCSQCHTLCKMITLPEPQQMWLYGDGGILVIALPGTPNEHHLYWA
jgi:hypothetical protein